MLEPVPLTANVAPVAVPFLELGYAPAAAGGRRPWVVVVWGVVSTALALLAVKLVEEYTRQSVLGWFVFFIVPLGALLVGAASGIGYTLSARFTGTRTGTWLLLTMLLVQPAFYFIADYIGFHRHHYLYTTTLRPVGYPHYFHLTTTSVTYRSSRIGGGVSLGGGGYVLRVLEIGAFTIAAMLVAEMGVVNLAYCHLCRVYMRNRTLAYLPASQPLGARRKDVDATTAAEARQIVEAAVEASETVMSLAAAGNFNAVRELIAELKPGNTQANRLPCRVEFSLQECPRCGAGMLRTYLLTGPVKQPSRQTLDEVQIAPTAAFKT